MKIELLLGQALAIQAPWQISRVRNDFSKDQVDVWVVQESARSSWFFSNRNEPQAGIEQSWRHINLGHLRCVVHAVRPPVGSESLAWIGADDQPFTHTLSRQVAGMLRDGISFQSICHLLDVTVADLWKFKHSLDSGRAGLSALEPSIATSGHSRVPENSDPVWEKLLDGSLNIDIRILSLKLLLTKLREQFAQISDSEVRIMKAHEMQRYFVRHEKLLAHELAQLPLR